MFSTNRDFHQSEVSYGSLVRAWDPARPPMGQAYDITNGKIITTAFNYFIPAISSEVLGQWHLTRLGDLGEVWKDYTGKGVSVGVYDEGVQSIHWDLSANYDSSRHVLVDGTVYGGDAVPGAHGTSVAGLIAAARNGRGGVGVAYDSAITGVNIFDPDSPIYVNGGDRFLDALFQMHRFDITNHSWGSDVPNLSARTSRAVEDTFAYYITQATAEAAAIGRDGLGTIRIVAAGNVPTDMQSESSTTDRHSIAVTAYRYADGASSGYSSNGPHVLVAAPSNDVLIGGRGLSTTDLLGSAGYNMEIDQEAPADYTDLFGGTSGAAPIVSGVVALMLEANGGLGWRDVREILSKSAKMPVAFETGVVAIVSAEPDGNFINILNNGSFKITGSGGNWNGGGMHYSTDYGYGAIDAYNAVRMAEVWSLFGPAKVSSNEVMKSTGPVEVGIIHDGDIVLTNDNVVDYRNDVIGEAAKINIGFEHDLSIEHIDLHINYEFFVDRLGVDGSYIDTIMTEMAVMQFKLTAPDGTSAFSASTGQYYIVGEGEEQSFVFGFSGFRGSQAKGEWTLEVQNLDMDFTGLIRQFYDGRIAINSLKLDMFGSAPTVDDVYTYTDEFFTMTAIAGEDARKSLSDPDGGVDWINAAAVSRGVDLSLVEGATTRFDGRTAFTIAQGTQIEHAVTGDGNDRLFGNALDNKLYGMRGNDWLNGGAGDDTLYGGQGNDVFAFDTAGVSGNDRILDWSTGDRIATSRQLRGADQNGLLTVGSNALVLLDNSTRGDTAELVDQGGAVLRAMGRTDGYWWYAFVSGGSEDFVDGRVRELALGQSPSAANDVDAPAMTGGFTAAGAMQDSAFFLYDTMGASMASGAMVYA